MMQTAMEFDEGMEERITNWLDTMNIHIAHPGFARRQSLNFKLASRKNSSLLNKRKLSVINWTKHRQTDHQQTKDWFIQFNTLSLDKSSRTMVDYTTTLLILLYQHLLHKLSIPFPLISANLPICFAIILSIHHLLITRPVLTHMLLTFSSLLDCLLLPS